MKIETKSIVKYGSVGMKGLVSGIVTHITALILFGVVAVIFGVSLGLTGLIGGGIGGGLALILAGLSLAFYLVVWGYVSSKLWRWR